MTALCIVTSCIYRSSHFYTQFAYLNRSMYKHLRK